MDQKYYFDKSFNGTKAKIILGEKAEYESCHFSNCNFAEANLEEMKFVDCEFIDCKLTETDFTGSNLKSARFESCDLDRAIFEQCILEKADFRSSYNLALDPENNKIYGAKFSLQNLPGLLQKYKLQVDWSPQRIILKAQGHL